MSRSGGSRLLLLCVLVWGAIGASDSVPSATPAVKPSSGATLKSRGPQPAKESPKLAAKEDPFTATDVTIQRKSVRGPIVAITKRMVSIETSQTKEGAFEEMLFPVDAPITFSRVKAMSELKAGDVVEVGYKQAYRKDAAGESVKVGTRIESLTLVKRAATQRLGSSEAAPSGSPEGAAP